MLNHLPPQITVAKQNQLDILEINHSSVRAQISLQGAQLLHFQPAHTESNVLWLSDIEPFEKGSAIRGGVPICYPWFGNTRQPAHGIARISQWTLNHARTFENRVELEFQLEDQAKITLVLGETALLTFTHLGKEPAQVALHSYFHIHDISRVELYNLPHESFNSVEQQQQGVSSPRKFTDLVDEIYSHNGLPTRIVDPVAKREITVEHQNATEIVVWNPWHKITSNMSENGHKTMVCVETARLTHLLNQGEQVAVRFGVKSA